MRRRTALVLVAAALASLAGCAGPTPLAIDSGVPTPTPTVMPQDVPQDLDDPQLVAAVDAAGQVADAVESELAEPVG